MEFEECAKMAGFHSAVTYKKTIGAGLSKIIAFQEFMGAQWHYWLCRLQIYVPVTMKCYELKYYERYP